MRKGIRALKAISAGLFYIGVALGFALATLLLITGAYTLTMNLGWPAIAVMVFFGLMGLAYLVGQED